MLGISWRTVGRIVERVVERKIDSSRLDDLYFIGVDEFREPSGFTVQSP